jgi:hypothetical protein
MPTLDRAPETGTTVKVNAFVLDLAAVHAG